MKKTLLLLLTITLGSSQSYAQLSADYKDLLDSEFKTRVELLRLKGASAAIVFPDGSTWSSAVGKYGTADLSTDLLYEIGSNTKTMVAAAILLLEEEGKLSLDDTLYKHLSPIPNVSYGITLRQLLNHTSGLFNFTDHPNFGPYVNSNWGTDVPLNYVLENFVSPPTQNPGGTWSYSNTNYFLLGMVLEKVTDKKLAQVFKEKLYTPLQLEDSYLAVRDSYTNTHLGTWLSNGQYFADPGIAFMSTAWAAGAVISTPEDLAMWAYRLYGGELLSDASFEKMNTTIELNASISYGLGMFKDIYKGKTYLGHGGTTLQNSEMQYSVSSDFSVATIVIEQGKATQANSIQNKLIDVMETQMQILNVSEPDIANSVIIYPNPSRDIVTIDNKQNKQLTAEVLSTNGQSLYTVLPTTQNIHLTKEQLGTGFFIVKITDADNGSQFTQKLIIQ
jgi:D-alanyl-D-alanine carboxypeptidase